MKKGQDTSQQESLDLSNVLESYKGKDRLEVLLELQRKFGLKFCPFFKQKNLPPSGIKNLTSSISRLENKNRFEWTEDFLNCISNEVEEIRNLLPWKHWKDYPNPYVINVDDMKEELIDVLHFLLSLFILWGMADSEEVFKEYMKKILINIQRQKDGY